MKKTLSLLLALALCLSLCACSESSTEQTEREPLTELEQQIVDYILQIALEEISDSSSVKLLSLGDYQERSKNSEDSTDYGPDLIVVQLMGTSTLTGTTNPYFQICLTTNENTSSNAALKIARIRTDISLYILGGSTIQQLNNAKAELMHYLGEAGDYIELSDSYQIEKSAESIDIKKLNTAIEEYWENLGI